MPASKKRKTASGLSVTGLELELALAQLRKFHSSFVVDEVPESEPMPADTFIDEIDGIILKLESRLNDPLIGPLVSYSFSAAEDEALDRFNVHLKGILYLQSDPKLSEAISVSRDLGSDKLWSNDNMYKHLSFLVNSCTDKNDCHGSAFSQDGSDAGARRSYCPRISQMDTMSGILDYTTIFAESTVAENYIILPPKLDKKHGTEMVAFFAAEDKASSNDVPLEGHLPQFLLELIACAKRLGKSHIRGALTTGAKWHFVVVDLNTDGDGAEYWLSETIEWKAKRLPSSRERFVEATSDESDPALIAGILSTWIQLTFEEFNGDE